MQGAGEGDLPCTGGGGGGRGRGQGASAPAAWLEGHQRGTGAELRALAAGTARPPPAALVSGARHVSTGHRGREGGAPLPRDVPGTPGPIQSYSGTACSPALCRNLRARMVWRGPVPAEARHCPANRPPGHPEYSPASGHFLSYSPWAGNPRENGPGVPTLTRGGGSGKARCAQTRARVLPRLVPASQRRATPGKWVPSDTPGRRGEGRGPCAIQRWVAGVPGRPVSRGPIQREVCSRRPSGSPGRERRGNRFAGDSGCIPGRLGVSNCVFFKGR